MNTASLHIRFNPLVKKIHNCSKCYLEIVPDVLDDEQLKKIYIKDDDSTIQCSIPMEYKIILRKHTEMKNDEYSLDCDFDKIYHSCVDLIVTSSKSFSSIKDVVKHKSETTVLDQIIADFASFNSEIIEDTNKKDNKVQEINMIFNKSSGETFRDLNTFSGNKPKEFDFDNEVYSINKPCYKRGNKNLDSKQMQNTNKAFPKSNNFQNQKTKARCDNYSAESKVLSFSPMCSINTKDEIVYPVSYQISHLKLKEVSNIFNYDHYINLNNLRQITKKKTAKNLNRWNNFSISNYSYTQRQSVEDRVSELIYLLKKEMLPLKLMLDETVRKSVAIGLSLGRGDEQACKSLAWNTTVENPHSRLLQKCKPQIESNRVISSNMDNEFEASEIARSLSFEVEAVPQDNRIQLTSSTNNSNPLNVKIKVRKKKGLESPQDAVLSIPKFGKTGSKPERIRLASSDQTIMSFNVFMEEADKKRVSPKTKKKFFGLFKLGGNLDTDNNSCRSKSEDDILTDNVSDIDDDGPPSLRKDYGIFGISKPGGCLDPPYGEDRYAYKASKNIQSTSTPYQTATTAQETTLKEPEPVVKIDSKNKLKSIDKKASQEDAPSIADKNTKTEKSSLLSLYQADTFKPSVEMSYSNSIITYPPPMTSSEIQALNEVNEKNMKNRSSIDRTSFQGPTDRYFGPKRDSSGRKSSKIEGNKGDKESMFLPEQTKYKLESKEHSKPKDDYLTQEIVKDAMLPVAGGLLVSTLLQSHDRDKPQKDKVIDIDKEKERYADEENATKIEEILQLKQKLPENKDYLRNQMIEDNLLPAAGGLIASTLLPSHGEKKLNQDGTENIVLIETNKDVATENKEIPRVEQKLPQQRDDMTTEVRKDTMPPIAGNLIAPALLNSHGRDRLDHKVAIEANAAYINDTISHDSLQIEKTKAEQDSTQGINQDIQKQSNEENMHIMKDVKDTQSYQATKPNSNGESETRTIPMKQKTHENKESLEKLSLADGLIESTPMQSYSSIEKTSAKLMLEPDLPINKDVTDEIIKDTKFPIAVDSGNSNTKDDFLTKEIVNDAILPVAGGLIISTLLQSHSKDKAQKDEIVVNENEKQINTHDDSVTNITEKLKVEQNSPKNKDYFTNEVLNDTTSSVASGLIISEVLQSYDKEGLKQDKSANIQQTETIKNGVNEKKVIPKIEQASLKQKDDYGNENYKHPILSVAEGLITSSLLHPQNREKPQQNDEIDADSAHIISTAEDHAIKNKEIPNIDIDQSQVIKETSEDEKYNVKETPSNILTKSPHVVPTKSDHTINITRNLKTVDKLTAFEENMDLNKDGEQTILEPDLITRHEEIFVVPASKNNEDTLPSDNHMTLEDNWLVVKEEQAKKDVKYNYRALDVEEVDSKIMLNNEVIEPLSILGNKYKEHSEEETLKQRVPLNQEHDAHNKANLLNHDELLNNKDKQLKKEVPEPIDEHIASQIPQYALESHTDKKSNSDLNFLRTSKGPLDEREVETRSIPINNEQSLQSAPEKDLILDREDKEPKNNLELGKETLPDVIETRELVDPTKIKPASEENSISPAQEKVVIGPNPNLPDQGLVQNVLLENDALNKDTVKEVQEIDIQNQDVVDFDSKYKSETRYESSQLFDDESSKVLQPLQFPLTSKKNIDTATDKSLKGKTYENETYSELTRPENEVFMLDLAFQSYINEDNKRVFRSLDNSEHIERYNDDRISSIKASVESGGIEIRVPIDSENDLSLSVQKKGNADHESKKISDITTDSYAEMSRSKEQLELSEENNDANNETRIDNIHYALKKGLQPLESVLVTAEENPDEQEAKLIPDYEEAGKQPEYKLVTGHENLHESELIPDLEKQDKVLGDKLATDQLLQQEPQLNLVFSNEELDLDSKAEPDDEKLDRRPEYPLLALHEEPQQESQLKLVTGGEKPIYRPDAMLVGRKTSDERPELLNRDTQRSDMNLGLVREIPAQRPGMVLVTGRKKPGERQELLRIGRETQWSDLKIVAGHDKTDQRTNVKLETGKKKPHQRVDMKSITNREVPDQLPRLKLGKYLDEQTEKLVIDSDSAIRGSDMFSLHHTLSSVYEKQLLPLQDLIKSLKQEIDSLSSQQELLRQNLVGVTKPKSMKVHVTKKCACHRKF